MYSWSPIRSLIPSLHFSLDLKNASRVEVRLSIREHLEARRFLAAQSAVHRAAGGPAARLLWEVRDYVARAGQCL